MEEQVDIIILGAGLTGLTIGYELRKKNLKFKIIDTSDRIGGVIQTSQEGPFMYENGPNTGIIGSPELGVLLEELKHDLQIQTGLEAVKRRLILRKGQWHALPSGLLSAISTPLFSLKDKFRILGEPFRSPGTDPMETLDKLVLRRMGKSFLQYAIDPFILGVYAGDPGKLVTQYAFPKLYRLEQKYGSFIGGSIKKKKEPKTRAEKLATREVFSFAGGLEQLIKVLGNKIGSESILLNAGKYTIQEANGVFTFSSSAGDKNIQIQSKKVISTLNATHMSAEQLSFIPESFHDIISKVYYAPTVEVILGFKQWKGRKLDAFGGLIPHHENRDLLGVLFLSAFLPNRAPEEGALLTIFMGGVRNARWVNASEEEIMLAVEAEMKDLMNLDEFNPDLVRIIHHQGAIPQYSFESPQKLAAIEELKNKLPGFYFAGNSVDGIGIADRVKQGVQVANEVADQFR